MIPGARTPDACPNPMPRPQLPAKRDRWLSARRCAGTDSRRVVADLAANTRRWRPIESEQGGFCTALR